MGNMVIVDSNIWIAFFHREDQTHKKAKRVIDQHVFSKIVITEYILLEVVTVLKQRSGWEMAERFLKVIDKYQLPIIESSFFFIDTVHLFRSAQENHLSFVDMSLVALSDGYEIETFDKRLKKEIFKRL